MPQLTVREAEIFRCMQQGLANKDIALRYGISVGTVKAHVRSIYRALNLERKQVPYVKRGGRYAVSLDVAYTIKPQCIPPETEET